MNQVVSFLLASALLVSQAFAGPVQKDRSFNPGQCHISNCVSKDLGSRTHFPNNLIRVLMELNLVSRHHGRQIHRVELEARTRDYWGSGTAVLVVNGREVGHPQNLSNSLTTTPFFLPDGIDKLGQEIRTLQIRLSGDVVAERLTVWFEPDQPNPGSESVEIYPNKTFSHGSDLLDLFDEFRMNPVNRSPYAGRDLLSVQAELDLQVNRPGRGVIRVKADAQLLINGNEIETSVPLLPGRNTLRVNLPLGQQTLGRDIYRLDLRVRNQSGRFVTVTLGKAVLELAPRPMPRIIQAGGPVNINVDRQDNLDLIRMFNLNQYIGMTVKNISITGKLRYDRGGAARLCLANGCLGQRVMFNSWNETHSFSFPEGKLGSNEFSQLMIELRGMLNISRVDITLEGHSGGYPGRRGPGGHDEDDRDRGRGRGHGGRR